MKKSVLIFFGIAMCLLENKTFGANLAQRNVVFNPTVNADSDELRQLNNIYQMWKTGKTEAITDKDILYLKKLIQNKTGAEASLAEYLFDKIINNKRHQGKTWEQRVVDVTNRLGYLLTNPPEDSFGEEGIRKEKVVDIPEWILDFLDELDEAQWLTALNQKVTSPGNVAQAIGILRQLANFFQQARNAYSTHKREIDKLLFSVVDGTNTNYISLLFNFALESISSRTAYLRQRLDFSIKSGGVIMEEFLFLMEVFCRQSITILQKIKR